MILIAGPCVIESWEQLERIGEELKGVLERYREEEIEFYFKASFDKANRTRITSYRGPGLREGLQILKELKERFQFPILTDVHESWQVELVAEVADIIQIPAFLCRQTDLLVEAGRSGKGVNIKKGQFLHPADLRYSVEKVLFGRGIQVEPEEITKGLSEREGIWVTERGSSFGYRNLVVDMRGLVIMGEFAPVIFDGTHSVQLPGGEGGRSGGDRRFVAPLARAAAAVGVDGFFFEVHFDPDSALSDGPNMITPVQLGDLLGTLFRIEESLKRER
jgi:2-dehydro-3-deoxyphosphooctonate aldolase (KDO 8-P synthase)